MIVEVLERRGVVRQRVRLTAYPATIGRGYGNEVILEDRYADPSHARLEPNGMGGLRLVDLGSVNGIVDAEGRRVTEVFIRSGTTVRIGRTTIRFVDPAERVDAALPDPVRDRGFTIGRRPLVDLALCGATGALLTINNYLDSASRVRWAGLLGDALVALLLVAIWAGGWALVNRITQQRFRFLEHLTIPCLAIIAYRVSDTTSEYLRFLVPSGIDWEFLSALLAVMLGVAVLAAHLARVSQLGRFPRWLWSIAVVGGLVAIAGLSSEGQRNEFLGGAVTAPLKPVGRGLIPTITVTQFLDRTDRLKAEVDDLVDDGSAADADDEAPMVEDDSE